MSTTQVSGGTMPSERQQERGPRAIRLVGTLENDPIIRPTQSGGEKALVRLKVTTPGFTFQRNGVEQTVAPKYLYVYATIVTKKAVDEIRELKAGDRMMGEGLVESYTPVDRRRPEIGVTFFNASRNVDPAIEREPNSVHLAGIITEAAVYKPNRGAAQLDSIDYKVKPFGRDTREIAVREFGERVKDLAAARAQGARVELDGRLTIGTFPGRNGKVEQHYIATKPREVTNLDERARDRSQERDRERINEIDREMISLAEDGIELERDGLAATEQYRSVRERYDALSKEREWLAMTPDQRAAMYEARAAREEGIDTTSPWRLSDAPQRTAVDSAMEAVDRIGAVFTEAKGRVGDAVANVGNKALEAMQGIIEKDPRAVSAERYANAKVASEIPYDFTGRVSEVTAEMVYAKVGSQMVAIERGAFSEKPEVKGLVVVERDEHGAQHGFTERQMNEREAAQEKALEQGAEIGV